MLEAIIYSTFTILYYILQGLAAVTPANPSSLLSITTLHPML